MRLPESTAARLGLFGVAVVLVFLLATVLGRLVPAATTHQGDAGHASEASAGRDQGAEPGGHDHGDEPSGHDQVPAADPTGQVQGYRLAQLSTSISGSTATISFVVLGPDQQPVTSFDVVHEKELHLIATRDDLSGFNHVHPTRTSAGVWTAQLQVSPGLWRIYADLQPAALGSQAVLRAEFVVPGVANPDPLPAPATTVEVDGYRIELAGTTAVGEQQLTFTITRDGHPVTDLSPYLGSFAHVVILREGDGAYSHVHPVPGPSGPTVTTGIDFEQSGSHRVYLEFIHNGTLHRAELTLAVG